MKRKEMTIHEKHCELLDKVNYAQTEKEHKINEIKLRAWRRGVEDAGITLNLCDADAYYMDQGYEGDLCCGVWFEPNYVK